jgi:hypothetical protein
MLSGASYSVYLDPLGWLSAGNGMTNESMWVGYGGAARPTIPRRSFCLESWAASRTSTPQSYTDYDRPQAFRNFCLMDDMTFNTEDPMPVTNGGVLERNAQYSYAFLIRRPVSSERTAVHLSVVVYFRRPIESPSEEIPMNGINIEPEEKKMTLVQFGATKPALRQGTWILDATMAQPDTTKPDDPQGYFYRIENIVERGNETDVYLDRAIRGEKTLNRNIIVLDGVIDVFDKGVIDMKSASRVN